MIALLSLAFAQAPADGPLDAAYQREYAYLQAEIAALESRQAALKAERQRRIATAEEALSGAQAEVLALTTRREQVDDELSTLLRDIESGAEGVDRVESMLVQAGASLPGVELPEGEAPAAQATAITVAFEAAEQRLRDGQGVTRTDGSWFRRDGTKATGTITRFGRIAAFGGDASLAPAGEGRLVTVDGDGVFLFEGEAKAAAPEEGKTIWDQLEAGGVVGVVILVLGAVGVVLAGLRMVGLWIAGRGRRTAQLLLQRLETHGVEATLEHAKRSPGAASRVITAVLDGPMDRAAAEDRAAEALLAETPAIERFGTAILVIAAVSPLLGLLGTVTGMIGTFEILTEFGTGDPRMLSGGISEALVTTQLGLIVAIPMLLVGNLLNRAAENLLGALESAALGAMNRMEAPVEADPDQRIAAK